MMLRQALSQLPGRAPVRAPIDAQEVSSSAACHGSKDARIAQLVARVGELEAQLLTLTQQCAKGAQIRALPADEKLTGDAQ
jgi:hypothetical protein